MEKTVTESFIKARQVCCSHHPTHPTFPRVSLHKPHRRGSGHSMPAEWSRAVAMDSASVTVQVQQIHGGKQSFQPALVTPLSESHSMIDEPSGTIPSGPSVPQ